MNWKQIIRSLKSRDMQKRLLVVLGIIVVYRFLAHVPVPLAEPEQLRDVIQGIVTTTNFGGFLNLLSGGALSAVSIMLVGLAPFITASIVMQLLTKAIPRLEQLHKDGESGRRKISQFTRLLTLPLAIVQSIAFIFILRQTTLASSGVDITAVDPLQFLLMVGSLTAGAMLLMWLGELITEQGIGNGMSLLIFAGIISQLPSLIQTILTSLTQDVPDAQKLDIFGLVLPVNAFLFWIILAIVLGSLAVLYALVKINEAQRIVTINYAKRVQGNRAYGGVQSILPVKLITAGVIPVIFASAFLALPAFIGQLLQLSDSGYWARLGQNLSDWFSIPGSDPNQLLALNSFTDLIYPIGFFVLVVFFTYFYTNIVFNANEIAENLQKQGGFIANIRPGKQTEKYLSRLVNRVTLFGSIVLGLIAVLPFATQFVLAGLNFNAQNLTLGGVGILIVVTVSLETLRQINSRALMVTYDQDY